MYAGTDEQKERWLWPLLSGEEFWCQLFSEPGAGSDLASLTTRAERDGDHYVVNGQKVWNSYAHIAKWGILLARTDPAATKHKGISYFVCPMDAPGIDIRPLIDMTGEHAFNEVFFTDVRIPADHLIGPEHGGWDLAKVTLGNERVSLSGEGALWGMGPTADDLVDLVRAAGGAPDPTLRPPGRGLGREPDSAGAAAADGLGRAGRQAARGRGLGAQGHRRRPRPARHGRRPGPGRPLRHAGRLGPGGRLGPDGAAMGDHTWSRGFLYGRP